MPKQGVEKKKVIKMDHNQAVSEKGTAEFVVDSKTKNSDDNCFSVITKTTKPKIVIQSENIDGSCACQSGIHKHKVIKLAFFIVISSIVLITFFLSIETYSMVNELHQLLFN